MSGYMEIIPPNFIDFIFQPIVLLSDEFLILDINKFVEDFFNIKKKEVINQSFSVLCKDCNLENLDHPDFVNPISHIEKQIISWQPVILEDSLSKSKYILIGSFVSKEPENLVHFPKNNNTQALDSLITHLSDNTDGSLEPTKNIYNYMENIIAELPISVYWMNRMGVYLGCSNSMAKLLKLESRHDIVGKTYGDLYDPVSSPYYKKSDEEVMSTGVSLTLEEPLYHPDGTKEVYLSKKVPLRSVSNNIIGMLGISIDITERKKMEEERVKAKDASEAANYIMTEFIANMGHDLATPISDVGSIAQMLDSYSDDYPELKELLEMLAERATACEKVRKTIINATSISNLEVKPESFSIITQLLILEKELRGKLSSDIDSKNLKIIIHPFKPKKDDLIETDKSKFHDILFAFLSNAIKFTEEGQITVSVSKQDDLFHIKVIDTGIGIPEDKYDYIFQQYTKLSRSNLYGGNFKGVGAGLYLARLQANILNATISVESEVNKGSIFTLSIPVYTIKKSAH